LQAGDWFVVRDREPVPMMAMFDGAESYLKSASVCPSIYTDQSSSGSIAES
jgi:hypothetical protein